MIINNKDSYSLLIERDFPQYNKATNNQERYDALADVALDSKGKFLARIIPALKNVQSSPKPNYVTQRLVHQLEFDPLSAYICADTPKHRIFCYTRNQDPIQNALDYFRYGLQATDKSKVYSENGYKEFIFDIDTVLVILIGIYHINTQILKQEVSDLRTISILNNYSDANTLRTETSSWKLNLVAPKDNDRDRLKKMHEEIIKLETEIEKVLDIV